MYSLSNGTTGSYSSSVSNSEKSSSSSSGNVLVDLGTSIFDSVLGDAISKLTESSSDRNSRICNESVESERVKSNVASGTLESINAYLKGLYRAYTYHYKVKGRDEGLEILGLAQSVEATLLTQGCYKVGMETYTQSRSKGDYNVTYPVYAKTVATSVVDKIKNVFSSSDVVPESSTNTTVGLTDSINSSSIGVVLLVLALICGIPYVCYKIYQKYFK